MKKNELHFHSILSSDWSECLSPSGPFDFIAFNFPQLEPVLNEIFRSYTGNRISLGEAGLRIKKILPEPVTTFSMEEMAPAYVAVPDDRSTVTPMVSADRSRSGRFRWQ